jgi:hypothetical protein
VSKAWRAIRNIASVAPRVRWSAGVKRMLPTSITRSFGVMRRYEATPTARPDARSTMLKKKGSSLTAFCARFSRKAASLG